MYKALIAEDDNNLNRLYTKKLTYAGFDCFSAHTVAEAIQYLAQNDVELVVLDLNFPDGSGVEIVEYMKATPRLEHVPLIVVSGYAYAREHRVAQYDINAILLKPISPRELVIFAQSCLSN